MFVLNLESRLAFMRRNRGRWQAAFAREIMVVGAAARWAYWKLRLISADRDASHAAYARIQVERFQAVLEWRFRRNP